MRIPLLGAVIFCFAPLALTADEQKRAWLDVTQDDGIVRIEVFSLLEKGLGGKYQLEVVKKGPSGQSINRQGGQVPISDGEAIGPVSVSRVSLEPEATLVARLTVTDTRGGTFRDEIDLTAN